MPAESIGRKSGYLRFSSPSAPASLRLTRFPPLGGFGKTSPHRLRPWGPPPSTNASRSRLGSGSLAVPVGPSLSNACLALLPISLLLLVACGSTASPPPEPNQHLEGSRLAIYLPDGFVRIPHQPGWVNEEDGISVMLGEGTAEDDAHAQAWMAGYVRSVSQNRGGTEWDVDERNGRMLFSSGDTLTHGVVFREDSALGGVLVLSRSRDHEELARDIARSAQLNAGELNALRLMQVAVTPAEGLVLSDATSALALFLPSDAADPYPPGMPTVRLQHVILDRAYAVGELGRLVGRALRELSPDLENAEAQPLEVDGLEALSIAGRGRDRGVDVWVRAVLIVQRDAFGATDGAFLWVAHAAEPDLEEPVQAMMESLRAERPAPPVEDQ